MIRKEDEELHAFYMQQNFIFVRALMVGCESL